MYLNVNAALGSSMAGSKKFIFWWYLKKIVFNFTQTLIKQLNLQLVKSMLNITSPNFKVLLMFVRNQKRVSSDISNSNNNNNNKCRHCHWLIQVKMVFVKTSDQHIHAKNLYYSRVKPIVFNLYGQHSRCF